VHGGVVTLDGAAARVIVLYGLMYAAFGVSSPFMPAFFEARGLGPEQLGVLFATGTAIRLISGPLCGRVADLTQALRAVLVICTAVAALVALGLLPAAGFWMLLTISVLEAAALAPITTLADAIALALALPRGSAARFEYGWARGTGSAAFIAGTLLIGQVVSAWGLPSIVVSHAALLLAAAGAGMLLPEPAHSERLTVTATGASRHGVLELLRLRPFRYVILVSALVLGSHAMHDAFAVIRWRAAGVTPAMASALWSESVAAEVVVFFLVGPALVARLGPAGAMALAAGAGALRWVAMALTTDVAVLALVQPLHGLTFAALHLACMRLIAAIVPRRLAATAQALYAFGATATTALLTLASGRLYAKLGAEAFLVMALLCAAAAPFTLRLRGVHARPER
jgi:MFS transporter, PPP family, 3-phenylpropionic acid transporter